MNSRILLLVVLLSKIVSAESLLEKAMHNTDTLEINIKLTQERINKISGSTIIDIARRTNLENDLQRLRREKSRRLLKLAIEGTDTASMNLQETPTSHRYRRRNSDLGNVLNNVMDNTIKESNPAIAGEMIPTTRPLVLYRDVDPADIFIAKDQGEEFIVYKSKDLRGRVVYKDLKGNITGAVVQQKLFTQEEVIFKDEVGNLKKGLPRAIYPDGTLEIKDSSGVTIRRRQGAYHLTPDSAKTLSLHDQGPNLESLSDKEVRALKALKKAMCGL